MKYLKTPLRYPGGKSRVAPMLLEKFPSDIKEFREPFLGGASVALLFSQKYPEIPVWVNDKYEYLYNFCLLYTSPSPRDATLSRMPSSA